MPAMLVQLIFGIYAARIAGHAFAASGEQPHDFGAAASASAVAR
jgi:hypothetical protein